VRHFFFLGDIGSLLKLHESRLMDIIHRLIDWRELRTASGAGLAETSSGRVR